MSDRQTPKSHMHTSNHDGSAARGAQYRDDQPAGVDNSQQAAQGCRVAAGASGRRADTCPLGTADSLGHTSRSGSVGKNGLLGWIAKLFDTSMSLENGWPHPSAASGPRKRLRYDWFLRAWVGADHVIAVTVGGPFHGQPVRIPREGLLFPPRLYTRHDFTHAIPYPLRYTVVLAAGTQLPPSWETRKLAHRAGVIRWAGKEEMERISCLAAGVRYGEAQ